MDKKYSDQIANPNLAITIRKFINGRFSALPMLLRELIIFLIVLVVYLILPIILILLGLIFFQ